MLGHATVSAARPFLTVSRCVRNVTPGKGGALALALTVDTLFAVSGSGVELDALAALASVPGASARTTTVTCAVWPSPSVPSEQLTNRPGAQLPLLALADTSDAFSGTAATTVAPCAAEPVLATVIE